MVYLHLAEGFEEMEAVIIADVLRRARIDIQTVSMMGDKTEVTGAHDIPLIADITYDEADYEACSMIILPGGQPGTQRLNVHSGLTARIKAFDREKKLIAAICAAPMVLAECGILKGRQATIYRGMEDKLDGAVFSSDSVVISDHIITSRGPGTAFEFALKLVELLKDAATATDVREGMMVR